MSSSEIFDEVVDLPSPAAQAALDRLVGLDAHRERLVKEVLLLLDPKQLEQWCKKHHMGKLAALDYLAARPPLFVLAGDVGTGKSVLARSFGTEVARSTKTRVKLYALSLNARGTGDVGQMTGLITTAFAEVKDAVSQTRDRSSGRAGRGVILLIDEADALAQSRETEQMHHEDRAGVNALIRGIDSLAGEGLPVAVIMCTNRLSALDPAVRRRAAAVLHFQRPDLRQRSAVLARALEGSGFSAAQIEGLAQATGADGEREYGWTFSDLADRLVPSLVLDAFPDRPLRADRAMAIAEGIVPTPPFQEHSK